jgi:thiamine pyrophosphate-dependent acetolactate synthase large subunit-like protein
MTTAHDPALDPIKTPRTRRAPVVWRDRHALKIGAGLLGVILVAGVTELAWPGDDLLVVPGLGSTAWDAAAAGDNDRNFYLWGAMGGAAMIGLGLALAQPRRRVAVITGDGEMLMGLGSLATVGTQRPRNLAVIVFDNGIYGETGMQPSHTQSGVDLIGVAGACGIGTCLDVRDQAALADLAHRLKNLNETLFARVLIAAEEPPRVLPLRDGVALKERFRSALGIRA